MVETEGPIGFEIQKKLLNRAQTMVSEGIPILLSADRFYETAAMIEWCQKAGWQYRIRLKSTLILAHEGGEITTGQAAKMGLQTLENVRFHQTNVVTPVGILHEPGHRDAWITAMDYSSSHYKTLDYSLR